MSDKNLLNAIISDSQATKEHTVVEVGAGAGALTVPLCAVAQKVIAYEIDKSLESVLTDALRDFENVELRFCDFLKTPSSELDGFGKNYKVVANLPYYITTPVIFKFLESQNPPKSLTLTLQLEVAQRLCAQEKTPDYGAVTVAVQSIADVKITRRIARTMFFPVPNVDSAVINIELKDKFQIENKKLLSKLIRAAFAMRRKMLTNNLTQAFGFSRQFAQDLLQAANIQPNARGEDLSVKSFVELSNLLVKLCPEIT